MPFTLFMPKLSPTMEMGTLIKWHKKIGDEIKPDDLLFEVATDKATVEYNAIDAGWLSKILVQEGQDATVNQPVAVLTESKDESIEGYSIEEPATVVKEDEQKKQESAQAPVTSAPKVEPQKPKPPSFSPPPVVPSFSDKQSSEDKRILASPLAKRLAKEKGVDLQSLQGTGPSGRIMSRDLVHAKSRVVKTGFPDIQPGTYTEETLTPMRRVISQRLQESKTYIPHFYVQQTINAEALVAFREQLKHLEYTISYNDCVVKACALALREHPVVNSGFNASNNTLIRFQTIDISVAVSIPGGLITPIVRFADYKELQDISSEIKELAKRAKAGKLEAHEYQGGSFSISNLGMYGTTSFQAIINPPQAAILAVGGILDTPVVKNGAIVPGKTMNVTLSVDHRVVDGVAAAEYLKTVQKYLENPTILLLN